MTTVHFRTCPACGLGIVQDADGIQVQHICIATCKPPVLTLKTTEQERRKALQLARGEFELYRVARDPNWNVFFVEDLCTDVDNLLLDNARLQAFFDKWHEWQNAMKEVAVPTFLVGAITNVDRARLFATMAHAGQKDKAGVPYIDHPAAVAAAVKHLGEDYEIAAWLHDVVEDCGIKMPIIYANFLSIVGDAVGTLTHRVPGTATSLCYEDYILDCRANTIARAVKIADLKHNLLPERICKLKDPLSKMARYHAALAVLEAE